MLRSSLFVAVLVLPLSACSALFSSADSEADAQPGIVCGQSQVACGDVCLDECETEFSEAGQSDYTPVPGCTEMEIHAWGAGGGNGTDNLEGAAGGYSTGLLEFSGLTSDFIIVVGRAGASANDNDGGAGGNPGGGNGGNGGRVVGAVGVPDGGGGGGGFSGVYEGFFREGALVLIAGGGGGSGGGGGTNKLLPQGGAGGGLVGESGGSDLSDAGGTNQGGTQSTGPLGDVRLQGEDGASYGEDGGDGGGGGGGGWYGGEGGKNADNDAQGGAGGSARLANTLTDSFTEPGAHEIPGNKDSPFRGDTAGEPTRPGKVVIICRP